MCIEATGAVCGDTSWWDGGRQSLDARCERTWSVSEGTLRGLQPSSRLLRPLVSHDIYGEGLVRSMSMPVANTEKSIF